MPIARQKIAIGLALAVLAAAGAGLAAKRRASGLSQASASTFDVVHLANNIADGAHVADVKGFFKENRIRIEWTGKQAHGPAAIVSLLAGQNDAAGWISTAMIIARTHGSKLKIIASQTLSSKQSPLFVYLVKDGSSIGGNPVDFLGKKVVASPTTITWYPLVVLLKRAGLDYKRIEFVQLPSPLASEQALRQGDVDVVAGSQFSPPGSKLLAEGGVHAIPGVSDYDVLGIPQIGGWAMREDFIAKHPDVVRRFIASLAKAHTWANAHAKEAQEIVNERNEVPQAYRKFQSTWREAPPNALVDGASIKKWIAILEEFGQIEAGAVKPEQVYTNDFNAFVDESSR